MIIIDFTVCRRSLECEALLISNRKGREFIRTMIADV
jgi:hypothetical protein